MHEMMEISQYLILAVGCLLAAVVPLICLVEFYDAIAGIWRYWRRREPQFYPGGSGFRLGASGSLLRQRHRRRAVLRPLGGFGFDAKWVTHD